MTLGSAENVAPGKDVNNFHARSRFLVAPGNSDDGKKLSLDGRPYQVERRSQRLRHRANSAVVGASAAW
jgi:hypothetical protein